MKRSMMWPAAVLAIGVALGYAAATGKFNMDRLTAVQPKAEEKAAQPKPADSPYKFERGYPAAGTADRVHDASDLRRAIEPSSSTPPSNLM
jgi:hypothetical protein